MAFKNVNTGESGEGNSSLVYASKMKVGDSIEGYLVGLVTNKLGTGKNIVLQKEDGTQTTILAAGNLNFFEQDYIKTEKIKLGQMIRINKFKEAPSKKTGKLTGRFFVEKDDSRSITVANQAVLQDPVKGTQSVEARLAELKKAKQA